MRFPVTNQVRPNPDRKVPSRTLAPNSAPGLALLFASLLAPGLRGAPVKPLAALEGKLMTSEGKCPILKMPDKEQPLSASTPYLLHTLQDERLNGRAVRVEGMMKPDGTFEAEWLYTLHNGRLYRVRYFCKVCNIVALEPGPCVCCQQPTELQEIPKD